MAGAGFLSYGTSHSRLLVLPTMGMALSMVTSPRRKAVKKGKWVALLVLGLLSASVIYAETSPYNLSIEIYAGLTNADQSMSRPFLQELMAFKEGTGPPPAELSRILHLEHPAAPDFDLVGEGQRIARVLRCEFMSLRSLTAGYFCSSRTWADPANLFSATTSC